MFAKDEIKFLLSIEVTSDRSINFEKKNAYLLYIEGGSYHG